MARLARRQHGVVSFEQLLACGLTRDQIKYRLRQGRLHLLHRGVYAVGHASVSLQGHFLAGVLAIEGSVLSHRSAAVHWELLRPGRWPVEVTSPRRARSRSKLRVHEGAVVRVWRDEIPVTPVARTLLDCATVLDHRLLRRAVSQAELARRVTLASLREEIARSPGHHGAKRLAALIAEGPRPTRSGLEDDLLDLIARHGLPRPEINVMVAGYEVDLFYPAQRVVIEADSRRYHDGLLSRRRDQARDAALQAAGCRTLRITDVQLEHAPAQTVQRIRRAVG